MVHFGAVVADAPSPLSTPQIQRPGGWPCGGAIYMTTSLVIGGGFVGLSCALHLQRLGRRVTLLDRSPVSAAAASFGNAGTMAVYANVPVNSPGVLRRLPSMLMDSNGPLSVKPTAHLPSMLPWAALFAWNCRRSAVEHSARALGALLSRAESGYEAVFEQAGVDVDGTMGEHSGTRADAERPFAVRHGYLLVQRTPAVMEASAAGAALRRRFVDGLRMEALSQAETLALEPHLSPHVCEGGAWFFPDGWFLSEPAALMRALLAGFERRGGAVRVGSAVALAAQPGAGVVARLSDGSVTAAADEAVVAAGAHSGALAASVGDWCPLDTERGYHVAFGEGSEAQLTHAAVASPTPACSGLAALPCAAEVARAAHLPAPPGSAQARRVRPDRRLHRVADGGRAARGGQGRARRPCRRADPGTLRADRARVAGDDRRRRPARACA